MKMRKFKWLQKTLLVLALMYTSVAIYLSFGGFGLRAGPFEIIIETDEPADGFVIQIDNKNTAREYNINPGGGYKKATEGSSNTPIIFPSDWLYTATFAGLDRLRGHISHPKYTDISFSFYHHRPRCEGVVVSYSDAGGHKEICWTKDQGDIRLKVKPYPIEEWVKLLSKAVRFKPDKSLYEGTWEQLDEQAKQVARMRSSITGKVMHLSYPYTRYFYEKNKVIDSSTIRQAIKELCVSLNKYGQVCIEEEINHYITRDIEGDFNKRFYGYEIF